MVAAATALFPEELHFSLIFGLLGLSFILGRDTPYWLFVALVLAIRMSLSPYQLRNPSQASHLKTCYFPHSCPYFNVAEMLMDEGPDISGPLARTSAPKAGYIRP